MIELTNPTEVVIDFLQKVDLDKWRENLPIMGLFVKDQAALEKAISSYFINGVKYHLWPEKEPEKSEHACAELVLGLAKLAFANVSWVQVLQLWTEHQEPTTAKTVRP